MPSDSGYPQPIQELVAFLRRLPGIGSRTAERLTLALLEWPEQDLTQFGEALVTLRERICACEVCGNLADTPRCRICRASDRDTARLCVVETAAQIPVIEHSGCYRGLYHVLGGRLMPLEGRGPEDLRMAELHQRLAAGGFAELILATSPDVEGEATASFIAGDCAKYGVQVTRIAAGVPVGADLSFADSATIAMAMAGRRDIGQPSES